jgi:hypothetical protein
MQLHIHIHFYFCRNKKLDSAQTVRRQTIAVCENLEREVELLQTENRGALSELGTTKKQLEDATKKATNLMDINVALCSEMKIQKKITQNIKREVQMVNSKRRNTELELEVAQKATERVRCG